MEKKELPPPYPGPAFGFTDPLQIAAYPPQPAVREVAMLDPPPYNAAMVPSEITVIQDTPAPIVLQSTVQPPVTIVQQAPPPTIIQPAVQQAIMMVNPVVVQPRLREVPGQLKCTYCQHDIVTVTRYVNGVLVWGIFTGLCLFLIWPFCLIPFCVNACKDVEHSCPNCHSILYIYRRA